MKKYILSIFCICFIALSGCDNQNITKHETIDDTLNYNQQSAEKKVYPDGSIGYSDGTMILAEGSFAHSLRDSINHQKINQQDILKNVNGTINGIVTFQQNIPAEAEYLLIIMIDYIQQPFSVDGQEQLFYSFNLSGDDKIEINIELKYPENSKELTYLIVSEPNMKDLNIETNEGWNNLFLTQSIYKGSCFLNDRTFEEDQYNFDQDFYEIDKSAAINCFLTKDVKNFTVMPSCNSNDGDIKLAFGNVLSTDTNCIMVAFLNWEQVPIRGDTYKLVKIKGDKNYYYDLDIPSVNEPSSYQVLIFYNPFNKKESGMEPASSFRTIIYE